MKNENAFRRQVLKKVELKNNWHNQRFIYFMQKKDEKKGRNMAKDEVWFTLYNSGIKALYKFCALSGISQIFIY